MHLAHLIRIAETGVLVSNLIDESSIIALLSSLCTLAGTGRLCHIHALASTLCPAGTAVLANHLKDAGITFIALHPGRRGSRMRHSCT